MDILTLTTTDSILESVVSAFAANGYASQATTKTTTTKNMVNHYFSLKKGKRVIRFEIFHDKVHNKIWHLASQDCQTLLFGLFSHDMKHTSVIMDIKGLEEKIAKLNAAALEIKEGQKLQSFKLQLVIPYIQGKIEEFGFKFESSNSDGKKYINCVFSDTIGKKLTLTSIEVRYEILNKIESFDDLPFKLYEFNKSSWSSQPIYNGTLGEIFTALTKYNDVRAEVSKDVIAARKSLAELTSAFDKINLEMSKYKKIISNSDSVFMAKLKQIVKDVKDGNNSST